MKSISAITRPPGVDGRLYEFDAEKKSDDELRTEGAAELPLFHGVGEWYIYIYLWLRCSREFDIC